MQETQGADSGDDTVSPSVFATWVCYAATVVVAPNAVVLVSWLSLSVPDGLAEMVFWGWVLAPSLLLTGLVVRFGIPVPGTSVALGRLSRRDRSLSFEGHLSWYAVLLVVFPVTYYLTSVVLVLALRLPGLYALASRLPMQIVEPGPLASLHPIFQMVVNAGVPPLLLVLLKAVSLPSMEGLPTGG